MLLGYPLAIMAAMCMDMLLGYPLALMRQLSPYGTHTLITGEWRIVLLKTNVLAAASRAVLIN